MSQSRVSRTRAGALAMTVVIASIGAAPISAPSVAAAHPVYEEVVIVGPDPVASSRGEFINDAGRATVYAGGGSGLWSWTEAGGLEPVPQIASLSMTARAMNASGQIAGTANSNTSAPSYAFRWTPGGTTEQLATLSTFGSAAADINDAGIVVGRPGRAELRACDDVARRRQHVDIGRPGHQSSAQRVSNAGHVLIHDFTANEWYVRSPGGVEWPLGHLGGGGTNASDMNNLGHVVGLSSVGGARHGFFWSESTGMVDIGSLGGEFSLGSYINDNDQVAGRATLPGDNVEVSWFWSASTGLVQIPTLGGDESNPNAINDNGVVVGYVYTATDDERATCGTLSTGRSSSIARGGDDINNSGQIIATRERVEGGTVAVLFREPQPDPDPVYEEVVIVGPDPVASSRGEFINDAGRATVYAGGGSGLWSWTEAGGLEPVPRSRSLSMTARAMNASGQIAGTANSNTSAPSYAFRWTPGGTTEQLATLSTFGSAAADINDAGIVVGTGLVAQNFGHATMWLADGSIVDIGRPGHQSSAQRVSNAGHVLIHDFTANEWYVRSPGGVEWPLGHLGGGGRMRPT